MRTPLQRVEPLDVWLKCEQPAADGRVQGPRRLQRDPRLRRGARAARRHHLLSGNHGQAVAFAAQRFGVRAVIVMPETAPAVKVDGVQALRRRGRLRRRHAPAHRLRQGRGDRAERGAGHDPALRPSRRHRRPGHLRPRDPRAASRRATPSWCRSAAAGCSPASAVARRRHCTPDARVVGGRARGRRQARAPRSPPARPVTLEQTAQHRRRAAPPARSARSPSRIIRPVVREAVQRDRRRDRRRGAASSTTTPGSGSSPPGAATVAALLAGKLGPRRPTVVDAERRQRGSRALRSDW